MNKCEFCPLKNTLKVCPAHTLSNPIFCNNVNPNNNSYIESMKNTIVNISNTDISKESYNRAPEDFFQSLRDNIVILVPPDLDLERIKGIRAESFSETSKIISWHDLDDDIQLDDSVYKMSKNTVYKILQENGLVFSYLMENEDLNEFVSVGAPNCFLMNLVDPDNIIYNNSALYNICFSKEEIESARPVYRVDHTDDIVNAVFKNNIHFEKPSVVFVLFGNDFSSEYLSGKIGDILGDFEVKFVCFIDSPYNLDVMNKFNVPVIYSQNHRTSELIKTADILICNSKVELSRAKQSFVNMQELDRADLIEFLKGKVQSYNKLDLVMNFAKASAAHAANSFRMTPFKVMQERKDICLGCIKYNEVKGNCDVCGCQIADKVSWAVSSCPLGKWAATKEDDFGCGCGKK